MLERTMVEGRGMMKDISLLLSYPEETRKLRGLKPNLKLRRGSVIRMKSKDPLRAKEKIICKNFGYFRTYEGVSKSACTNAKTF